MMFEIPPISDDISVIPRDPILPKPIPKNVITSQKMLDESEINKCEMEVSSVKPFISVNIDMINPNNANLVKRSCKLNP